MAWKPRVETLLGHSLRPKQQEVFDLLLQRKSVFAVLPTCYGKSICFGGFPLAYEEMNPDEKATALVISPLNALMADQLKGWQEKGVSCVVLRPIKEMDQKTVQAIKDNKFSLIFSSPEVVQQHAWWTILKSIRKQIKLLAFDEGHLITRWGKTFRQEYLRALELRGILCKTTILIVTATATSNMIRHITSGLGLKQMQTVALPADRPEIFIKIVSAGPDFDESLMWYIKLLLEERENAPRAIIFSRCMAQVINIFFWMTEVLGNAWVKDGAFDDPAARLVEMYHGHTDHDTQDRIVANFRQPNSILRCVVATIAFGLGINIPNVRYILHWGAPEDSMAYWQEVGRASRDGRPSNAICYMHPDGKRQGLNSPCIIDIVEARKDASVCLRQKVLSYMALVGEVPVAPNQQKCCSNCEKRSQLASRSD